MTDPIAVVGAGIAGTSVAYHLGERTDAPVVVFERETVGVETTAKSTAVFRLLGDAVLTEMKRYGLACYNRFLADPRAESGYELLGRLEAATTAAGADELQERAATTDAATAAYLPGDELDATVVFPELDVDAVAGGLYAPNAGAFRPLALAVEFAERAAENGVDFRTDTPVVDVETTDGAVTALTTTDERVPVSHVVAAAGPWNRAFGRLAGVDLPIRHTLAPILQLDPPGGLGHTFPNLKHRESGYYFVGRPDGTVLVGHSPGSYADAGTEYDPDDVTETVPTDVRSGMEAVVDELVPSLADADVVDEWVGVRSLTPDGRPLVGETAVDGLSVVAFNSEGIQLAPAAGDVIAAQLADGDVPAYADALAPTRFTE